MVSKEIQEKIKPGVKVRVHEKAGGFFHGLVIARKHGSEPGATFTVRSIVGGVGVEKIYPIHSPGIVKVEVTAQPNRVRRAKLYYVRALPQKKIRKKLGLSF